MPKYSHKVCLEQEPKSFKYTAVSFAYDREETTFRRIRGGPMYGTVRKPDGKTQYGRSKLATVRSGNIAPFVGGKRDFGKVVFTDYETRDLSSN